MDSDDFFKLKDAASYLATEDAILRLVCSNPGYLEPTLSSLDTLRFRLVFDQWHDTGGGKTQIFGVYESDSEAPHPCLVRHVTIERGAFGSFDLKNRCKVIDKAIDASLIRSIEEEYLRQKLPAIREGSQLCTNVDFVEVEWMFNRTSRQASWHVPNENMASLHEKLLRLADTLIAIETH